MRTVCHFLQSFFTNARDHDGPGATKNMLWSCCDALLLSAALAIDYARLSSATHMLTSEKRQTTSRASAGLFGTAVGLGTAPKLKQPGAVQNNFAIPLPRRESGCGVAATVDRAIIHLWNHMRPNEPKDPLQRLNNDELVKLNKDFDRQLNRNKPKYFLIPTETGNDAFTQESILRELRSRLPQFLCLRLGMPNGKKVLFLHGADPEDDLMQIFKEFNALFSQNTL